MKRSVAEYGVEVSPQSAPKAWSIVLSYLLPVLVKAKIDALPNDTWETFSELPVEARAAQKELESIGRARPSVKNPLIDIDLDARNERHFWILQAFGAHTISVDLADSSGHHVGGSDDGGEGMWISEIEGLDFERLKRDLELEAQAALTPLPK